MYTLPIPLDDQEPGEPMGVLGMGIFQILQCHAGALGKLTTKFGSSGSKAQCIQANNHSIQQKTKQTKPPGSPRSSWTELTLPVLTISHQNNWHVPLQSHAIKSMAKWTLESKSFFMALIPQNYGIFLIVGRKWGRDHIQISWNTKAQTPPRNNGWDAAHGRILVSLLWALGVSGHQPHRCDVGRQMNAGCL